MLTSEVSAGRSATSASSIEAIVEQAFDTYARRLKAFARAAVRDEMPQTTSSRSISSILVREIKGRDVPDNIGGWLYRVCGNLIASRGRRRSVAERMKALLVNRSPAPAPEDQIVRADETARLHEVLAELPRDARVALLMAAEGFSSTEIGLSIGRTPGATATYICRARIRLRERLSGDGEPR